VGDSGVSTQAPYPSTDESKGGQLLQADWVALSREIDATSTLFRHGFAILGEYTFASRDVEAVFVCFAGGAEKLLKLTLGLFELDAGEIWLSVREMQKQGHRLQGLDRRTRLLIGQHRDRSSVPGTIEQLLTSTSENPGVWQVLSTLERYADRGRFHNLDVLGGSPPEDASPAQLWDELHALIYEANPDLMEESATGDYVGARRSINRIIGVTLGSWCELVSRSWITGVCGSTAMKWSAQLELGHPTPKHLRPG
jgi:hypothetical protein